MERDGFDVTPETLLSMEDIFKTKQDCTIEFITKTCSQGTQKEQYDMKWVNQFARYHTAEALHPALRDRSVASDFSVIFVSSFMQRSKPEC